MLFDIQNSREFMNLFLPEYGEDGCYLLINIKDIIKCYDKLLLFDKALKKFVVFIHLTN